MKKKELYVYLGKCIQKIRYNQYSQDELANGICSKFTLSRIENGKVPTDEKIIIKLLERLGYYYKDVVDMTIMNSLLKHLIAEIEYYNVNEIISDIHKLHAIIERNKDNILFYDSAILYRYLYMHYIENKVITINEYDLNTLSFQSDAFYTIAISIVSENHLLYRDIYAFISFFSSIPRKEGNIMIDFFHMLFLQLQGQTLEVNDIFNYHKEELRKDMKTYQLIRYRSVLAIGFIEYESDKAMRHFHKITQVHDKSNKKNNYFFITALGKAFIYIKKEDYLSAFTSIDNCIKDYPHLASYAAPYIIFLSLELNITISAIYLKYSHNKIANACIDYYEFQSSAISGTIHVRYMTKKFPPLLAQYRIDDPFVLMLRKEAVRQANRGHCYKTEIIFYQKLAKHCKEVIPL